MKCKIIKKCKKCPPKQGLSNAIKPPPRETIPQIKEIPARRDPCLCNNLKERNN